MKTRIYLLSLLVAVASLQAHGESQVQAPKSCCEGAQAKSSPRTSLLSAVQNIKALPTESPKLAPQKAKTAK